MKVTLYPMEYSPTTVSHASDSKHSHRHQQLQVMSMLMSTLEFVASRFIISKA